MADDKKYYWLRLDRNFFKRHDIRIIESMKNGKEYVLFYMKLLLESIDHEGSLRFNELIPYNDDMLSTITNTNIDIVRSAVKVFQQLDMLEILDDQTIYVTDTKKMLGEAKSTDRVKRFREKQKQLVIETDCNVTETLHETEIELEKEIDIDKDIKKDSKHKFGEFGHVRLKQSESDRLIKELGQDIFDKCVKRLDEYIQETGKKYKDHNLTIRRWVIDAVKQPIKPQQQKSQQKSTNRFNQFPQREYTPEQYADIERKLLNMED
jgi:predicted phage replisome organizer